MSQPDTMTSRGGPGRLTALIPLALFGLLVGVFGWVLWTGHDPSALPSAMIDKPVPEFNLPPLADGKPGIARSDLAGRAVLVNFFASWCVPCRAEHATLAAYAQNGGVPLYGIAYKDKTEDARHYIEALGDPYARIGQDLSGRTAIDFGVYGVPETYIVDAAGRIRYRFAGAVTPEVLSREILPRLAALNRAP